MRILSSAQSFGYGPASKLVTIAKWLRPHKNYHIDFLGDDVALTYVLQNSLYFNNIFEYSGKYPNHRDYDMVISVMNPYTIIWAWINNIKSIYVDSLFWFWNWDENRFSHLDNVITELKSVNNVDEVWALVKDVEPHDMQYIAYKLADLALVQKFSFEKDQQINHDKYRRDLKVTYIGPIIDDNKRRTDKNRNKVIISLSGLLSPLNREKEALRYSSLVMNLLDEVIGDLPDDIEIFLTTNPNVITEIRPINERINLVSLSNNAFLELLNETILLFAPAGITTLYESLNYDVPIFLLPEQHDGHYKNYLKLTVDKNGKEAFPELMFNTRLDRSEENDPDKEILAIQSLVKKGAQNLNDPVLQQMKEEAKKSLSFITDSIKRNELLQIQQNIIDLGNNTKIDFEKFIDEVQNNTSRKYPRRERIGVLADKDIEIDSNEKLESLVKMIGQKEFSVFTLSDLGMSKLGQIAKANGSKLYTMTQHKNLHEYKEEFNKENIDYYDKIYFLDVDLNRLIIEFIEVIDQLIVLSVDRKNIFAILAAIQLNKPVFCVSEVNDKLDFVSTQLLDIDKFIEYNK